jgi:hypothetical protein
MGINIPEVPFVLAHPVQALQGWGVGATLRERDLGEGKKIERGQEQLDAYDLERGVRHSHSSFI